MHLQEPPQHPAHLGHLQLQLGEQTDEPLEALLVPVDPEEIDLLERIHHTGDLLRPGVLTFGTALLYLAISKQQQGGCLLTFAYNMRVHTATTIKVYIVVAFGLV